jgi:hypothetical protein
MRNRHLAALATTVAAAVLGAGMVLLAPAAQAAGPVYPPAAPAISLSATVIDPGQSVTVTGTGFEALSAVTASWTGPGARGMVAVLPFGTRALAADAAGSVTTSITFSVAGNHVITLTGVDPTGAPISLTASVMVAGAPASTGELSHTGFPLVDYLLAAFALLLVGAVIVLMVRRHRHAGAPAAATTTPPATQPLEPANH